MRWRSEMQVSSVQLRFYGCTRWDRADCVGMISRDRRGRVNPTRNENRPNLYRFGSVLGSILFTDWVGVWKWEIWQVWVWVWIQLCCDYSFGFGFGFNLLYRLGWVLDLWKFTGSDLGLGSIYQTGWDFGSEKIHGFWLRVCV